MTLPNDVTSLLSELSGGRRQALDELMPIVYEELRQIAHLHLRGERTGHTLNTTALVHEAYVKLVDVTQIEWKGRAHFFAMASRAMRRILIDAARARKRMKRGGGVDALPLDEAVYLSNEEATDLLALDEALRRLEAIDPRQCRIIEYRFFSGLSLEETAELVDASVATVKRDWVAARAWLNRALDGPGAMTLLDP